MISGQYNNKESIKTILSTHGYNFIEHSNYLSCSANYRNVPDTSSVVVYYDDDKVIDYGGSMKWNVRDFLSIVTGQKSTKELDEYLSKNNIDLKSNIKEIRLKQPRIFSNEILKELHPVYNYWTKRGISEEVLIELKSGLYGGKGVFKNKYLFPVFNSKGQITLLAGRDVSGNDGSYKWILRGEKSTPYPLFINKQDIIDKKEIILTEGISDILCLLSCGIRTGICMFGTECGLPIINFLLKLQDIKIILSTNNDEAGQNSAQKAYKRLSKYFDTRNIKIKFPPKGYKDLCECLEKENKESILNWYKND